MSPKPFSHLKLRHYIKWASVLLSDVKVNILEFRGNVGTLTPESQVSLAVPKQ